MMKYENEAVNCSSVRENHLRDASTDNNVQFC